MTKVEIITYGCAMNKADSEMMKGWLVQEEVKVGEGEGDMVIVNTCTVKTPTQRKVWKKLKELEREGEKVIVTGCLPLVSPEVTEKFPKFSFLGTNIEDIAKVARKVKEGKRVVKISQRREISLSPKVRATPFREIIPIAEGCLGNCSYCCVKIARGKLTSLPKEKIIHQVKKALSQEVKEIWLTAQDTGAYGLEIKENLPSLLREIFKIPGKFFVRVGMMNPNHTKKFLDALIKTYKNEKIYKFLHIPVQSGDNNVLRDMNRKYKVDDFKKIVNEFRRKIPQITISTDIIAGFPTETEEQFQNSVKLIKEIKPEVLNISRYWSRSGTFAEKMKQLPGRETKRRSRIMNKVFQKIGWEQNKKKWLGWQGKVLVSDYKKNSYTGRNFAYKPIILHSEKNLLGKFVKVKIKDATYYDLRGEVV